MTQDMWYINEKIRVSHGSCDKQHNEQVAKHMEKYFLVNKLGTPLVTCDMNKTLQHVTLNEFK
jgi:hypothetical protein